MGVRSHVPPKSLAALCATATILLLGPAAADAAIFTVTTGADGTATTDCTTPVVGECGLREAVSAANAATSDDTINISENLLVSLTAGQDDTNAAGDLDIQTQANAGGLTIAGLGTGGATIFAPSLDRVIDNIGVSAAPVTVSNLGFGNGNPQGGANGGVFRWQAAAGDVTLDHVYVSTSGANSGSGGILYVNNTSGSGQTATIANSTFASSGAGIAGGVVKSNRALVVRDAVFDGIGTTNGTPATGGAIRLDGSNTSSTIDRSAFVGGMAYTGSAISVGNGARLTVKNTTIGENTGPIFGGGAIHVEGSATQTSFANVTFNNNTAAVGEGATFVLNGGAVPANQTVVNSIIRTSDPDSPNCTVSGSPAAAFASGGHNIQFRDTAGDTPCAASPGAGDLTADPLLLPATLPLNQYHYLPAAGSPAIDGGANCETLAGVLDQLKAARTQGAACDVGAIEQTGPEVPPVIQDPNPNPNTNPDPVTPTATLGKAKSKRNGTVLLPVTTTGAGALQAVDSAASKKHPAKIRPASATPTGPGTVKLRLRPSQTAKALLERHSRVRVMVSVFFTPDGGTTQTYVKKVTLKQPR
ncbi:MAG: choice-of-anchor Q domain-containing protein [Solirubrobacterales bacterium]